MVEAVRVQLMFPDARRRLSLNGVSMLECYQVCVREICKFEVFKQDLYCSRVFKIDISSIYMHLNSNT